MNNQRPLYLLFLLLVLALVGCETPKETPTETPNAEHSTSIPSFRQDGNLTFYQADSTLIETIAIEIAETDESREQGMMYRRSMDRKQGMLFIFEDVSPRRFWMANTYISLDLLFLNENLEIVQISKYAQPHSQEGIDCLTPAKYVLEVVAGFSDSYGLVEGQKISFERS